ncbi:MAG: carboxypeptidase regulatory-like domain-containing protein, partial [Patescibacteria group bacterium]
SADIYKFATTSTTDGSGEFSFSELEFDTYTFTPTAAANIATACPAHPLPLDPGINADLDLLLAPASPHSLRVSVVDPGGAPIPGAAVTLERSGVPVERRTDSCGQAFFPDTGEHDDFRLEVAVLGYTAVALDPFSVSGADQHTVTLNP